MIKKILAVALTKKAREKHFSDFQKAREIKKLKTSIARHAIDFFLISLGILSATFGFKGFLLTNHFIDGGATGISLLISALTPIPLSVLIVVINIPFVVLGYKIINPTFAIKTSIAITLLAISLAIVPVPDITKDNLLVALFGGFFLGTGIGLSVRGGAVIDGTEVLAIMLSKKMGTTMGDIILLINVFIFSAAAYFLSVETALYSMLTYLSASKAVDFIVDGLEEYTGVTIISSNSKAIRSMIISDMERGVTIFNGKGGYGNHGETRDIDILYTVVTRLELSKLNTEIKKIDPSAFTIISSVKDTQGGMIKKRRLKH